MRDTCYLESVFVSSRAISLDRLAPLNVCEEDCLLLYCGRYQLHEGDWRLSGEWVVAVEDHILSLVEVEEEVEEEEEEAHFLAYPVEEQEVEAH